MALGEGTVSFLLGFGPWGATHVPVDCLTCMHVQIVLSRLRKLNERKREHMKLGGKCHGGGKGNKGKEGNEEWI